MAELNNILGNSVEKYKFLINNIADVIAEIDLNGIVTYVSPQVHHMFGYNPEDIIGSKFFSYIHPDDRSSLIESFEKAIESEVLNSIELRLRHKEGDYIDVLTNGTLVKIDGNLKAICVLKDITEKKKVERELTEINQLKSELLERTSHELKTPLISVKGFTDLLLDLHKEKFDSETISILDEIKQGTEQLEMIINKLLETSHLASGKLDFKPIQDDLSFLIKFCVKNLRGLANTRKNFINVDIPDKLVIRFEKEKLYDVITNLIINAIKYTPPYGEINIRSEINGDSIIVSVKDNGIGLTKNEQKKIFKQFGKIERYGQGWDIGIEGTGMGLYTSKKIVELHGGKIWVESEGRNMGSKFCFSLPYNNE